MNTRNGNSKRTKPYKTVIVAPSCFYYHTPLYRKIDEHVDLDLTVYFCSDEALVGRQISLHFQANSSWGIEDKVLIGYRYEFLKNYSPFPSYLRSFFGLVNIGILNEIRKNRPDLMILMAWINPTFWLAILACKFYRIPFVLMTDQNIQNEMQKSRLKAFLKQFALGRLLFPMAAGFLSAGTSNNRFYEHYNVPKNALIPFAFSWGFEDLIQEADTIAKDRSSIRKELGIRPECFVVLFAGRFVPEKDLPTLLTAYRLAELSDSSLILVGDGALNSQINRYISENNMKDVRMMGFKNRNEIGQFFTAADVLVLPSRQETWGMVVNEALCYSLPIILSDQVGSGPDLLQAGENGYSFPAGDADALAETLKKVRELPIESRLKMGAKSRQIIADLTEQDLISGLVDFMDARPEKKKPSKAAGSP